MWAINLASVYIYIWHKKENVLQYLLRMMNFQTIGQWNLHNVIDVFSDVSKQTSFVKCNIKEEKSWICSWIGRKDSGKSYHERKHDVEFRNEFRILFLALLMHLCMCVNKWCTYWNKQPTFCGFLLPFSYAYLSVSLGMICN